MDQQAKGEKKNLLFSFLKRHFISGLAILFPVFVTLYIIIFVFQLSNKLVGQSINQYLLQHLGFTIPGLGLIALLGVIVVIGFVANHFVGKKLFPWIEHLLSKTPFVEKIYTPSKQLSDFLFVKSAKQQFKKVVRVEYPQVGSYSIGFITSEQMSRFGEPTEDLICVFIPLVPVPMSGFLLIVPRQKIKELDISVDESIKFIVSGGVISPAEKGMHKHQSIQ
ncbi:MAG: DUF502 domain-containing protein [Chlamydiota bacterium]|nr:DUF502 domain-containing protein [Chlamydiota bacterium]